MRSERQSLRLSDLDQGGNGSPEGRTIVLDALQGEVAVVTDEDTQFRIPGVEDPGLDDVEVGDKVGVLVARTEEGGLLAKVVLVRRNTDSLTDAIMALAEAYRLAGRNADATAAYQRVLELDPGNETAAQRLGELGLHPIDGLTVP